MNWVTDIEGSDTSLPSEEFFKISFETVLNVLNFKRYFRHLRDLIYSPKGIGYSFYSHYISSYTKKIFNNFIHVREYENIY
jgi:hypothetical protein